MAEPDVAEWERDSFLLKEVSRIVSGAVLTIWSTDGRKLASVQRGEDRILEAFLGSSRTLCWSSDTGKEYLEVHDDTNWLWILRAAEGDTTTVRCYTERPLPTPMLRCRRGHLLTKDFGASGLFRWMVDSKHKCCRCGEALESGQIRWVCKVCRLDHCFDCAEGETWAQAMSPGETTESGRVQRIEDFVDNFVRPAPTPEFTRTTSASLSPRSRSSASNIPTRQRSSTDIDLRAARKSKDREAELARREAERDVDLLSNVPYLGVRSLGRIQSDTLLRLKRLLLHGDLCGARRTLARARKLQVEDQELREHTAALKVLEVETGEFWLFQPELLD